MKDILRSFQLRELPDWLKWTLLPIFIPLVFLMFVCILIVLAIRWMIEMLREGNTPTLNTHQINELLDEQQEEEFILPKGNYPVEEFTSEGGLRNGTWEGYKRAVEERGEEDDPRFI